MRKARGQPNSAANGKAQARGSRWNLWHLAFFLSGLVVMGLVQFALVSIEHARSAQTAASRAGSGAIPKGKPAKPWGELEITPMVLDRPEELFETNNAPAPPLRWFFPNYSPAQLAEFIASCPLSAREKASLLATNKWEAAADGCRISPDLEVVKKLCPTAREKIYSVLAASRENPGQVVPFVFAPDGLQEVLVNCALSSENVALVRNLTYEKKGLRCFADVQLFELISPSNETRCLIKALSRVPTMLLRVQVTPQTDINALLDYWGGGGTSNALRPLVESMARVPGGADINVSYFMPSVPRRSLYTYPDPASPVREDCFWSSFNFFNDQPDHRFIDPAYANQVLQTQYHEVRGEKKFGDIMLLLEAGQRSVHMCVYVADDIVYTKNGGQIYQPWVLMKMEDMMVLYPSEKPLQWRVFRRKT